VLFHITFLRNFPYLLKKVLENALVLKVGVGLKNDCIRLKNDFKINVTNTLFLPLINLLKCAGIEDISHIPIVSRCKPRGLQALTALFLGFRISKKEAMTNW
jgi:ribonuclease D